MKQTKTWYGSKPECQICGNDNPTPEFVDGRTRMGPWALMCLSCHKTHGVGLGTGKGQKYNAETLEKVEG